MLAKSVDTRQMQRNPLTLQILALRTSFIYSCFGSVHFISRGMGDVMTMMSVRMTRSVRELLVHRLS